MDIFYYSYKLHIFFISLPVISFFIMMFPEYAFSSELLKQHEVNKYKGTQHRQPNSCIREIRVPKNPPSRSIEYENLLDQIDVYALSSSARKIALPCMVPPALRGKIIRSKAKLTIDWNRIIQEASIRHNLDPSLIAAVIKVESGFSIDAISIKGAKGPMQVMPATACELGVLDIFNPVENVDAGSRYLRKQIERFGCLELALAAYNAGPGAVTKYGGIPPYKETQLFIKKVLSEI